MGQFSILPDHLSSVEGWIVQAFIISAILTLGPWLTWVAYDFLIYTLRTICHEFPWIGGRIRARRSSNDDPDDTDHLRDHDAHIGPDDQEPIDPSGQDGRLVGTSSGISPGPDVSSRRPVTSAT